MDINEYANIYENETSFWWYLVLHQLVDSVVAKKAGGKKLQMFDAGCGTGRMMQILQKYGDVAGLDYSEEAIRFTKERGFTQAVREDLNTWESPEKYDLIVSLDVLYHSGIKDDINVIKQFYKALENGGTLILNLPAFEILKRQHDVIVHTQRRYRKRVLAKELENIGFKIEKASYRLPHLFFIILFSKLIKGKQESVNAESDLNKIPRWLNRFLYFMGTLENKWLTVGGTFPVGSSLFIVAKK
jgi:predicted TPR repeat methyltransferase